MLHSQMVNQSPYMHASRVLTLTSPGALTVAQQAQIRVMLSPSTDLSPLVLRLRPAPAGKKGAKPAYLHAPTCSCHLLRPHGLDCRAFTPGRGAAGAGPARWGGSGPLSWGSRAPAHVTCQGHEAKGPRRRVPTLWVLTTAAPTATTPPGWGVGQRLRKTPLLLRLFMIKHTWRDSISQFCKGHWG